LDQDVPMPKRSSKALRAAEVEKVAAEILRAATGGAAPLTIEGTKNPAAKPRRPRLLKRARKTKKAVGARRKAK
jgi:hypothetical protein